MDIKALLPVTHVLLGLRADDRRDLLRQLVAPLAADLAVTDPEQFTMDIERREAQVTMQVENGIALPHARSNAVRRLALAVGIAIGEGLAYTDDAEIPCWVCFLIAVPAFAPTAHLPLLQHLANFSQDAQRIARLCACDTAARAARQIISFKGI